MACSAICVIDIKVGRVRTKLPLPFERTQPQCPVMNGFQAGRISVNVIKPLFVDVIKALFDKESQRLTGSPTQCFFFKSQCFQSPIPRVSQYFFGISNKPTKCVPC